MTARDLIKRALRMLGVIDAGREPEAAEAADALTVLQSLLLGLPGSAHWTDVETDENYTAGENERIRVTTASAVTITLPTTIESDSTRALCCNQNVTICGGYSERAPKDGARVQITTISGGATSEVTHRYRADLGEWKQVSGLGLTDEVPINADLQDDLAAVLALRIAPEYPASEPSALVVAMAASGETRMRGRFGKRQQHATDLTLLRTSSNQCFEVS